MARNVSNVDVVRWTETDGPHEVRGRGQVFDIVSAAEETRLRNIGAIAASAAAVTAPTHLSAISVATGAVTKAYVDAADATKADATGTTNALAGKADAAATTAALNGKATTAQGTAADTALARVDGIRTRATALDPAVATTADVRTAIIT
jgi:hypothetical protein